MNRREATKTLAAVLSVPLLEQLSTVEALAFERALRAREEGMDDDGRHLFKTLDFHQNETVTEIAETIIPETDTAGAKAARVNEFIDLMLSDWFSTVERDRFLKGLAELDWKSRELANENCLGCDREQRVRLLEEQEEMAIQFRSGSNRNEDESPATGPFFDVIKWLTVVGYFTSELGMKGELDFNLFSPNYSGCVPLSR